MVLNQIDQVSWLVWKSYMLLVPGFFLGGHHWQPVWWTDHSVCFSVFEIWSWACLDTRIDHPSNCGCKLNCLCCCRNSNPWGWMLSRCVCPKGIHAHQMLIELFCIFSTPQSGDSYRWTNPQQLSELTGDLFARSSRAVNISSDGTPSSSNIFFSFSG